MWILARSCLLGSSARSLEWDLYLLALYFVFVVEKGLSTEQSCSDFSHLLVLAHHCPISNLIGQWWAVSCLCSF